jgi:hypothetical protein
MKIEQGAAGDTETRASRNLRAMAVVAKPNDALVRLKGIAVVSVTSDGVLCFANTGRFCIPWGELHHPPPRALKAHAIVDMVVSEPFARAHRLI